MNKGAVTGPMETVGLSLRGRKARVMWLDGGREPQFRLSGLSAGRSPDGQCPQGLSRALLLPPLLHFSFSFLEVVRQAPGRWSPSGCSGSGYSLPASSHACISWGPCPAPCPARGEGLASGRGCTVPCGTQPAPCSFRNAACSTPSGFASLVSRRTSLPSLRKSGKTCRKGRFHQRGPPPSPALGPECGWLPGPQRRLHGLLGHLASVACVTDGLSWECCAAGTACAAGGSWSLACSSDGTGAVPRWQAQGRPRTDALRAGTKGTRGRAHWSPRPPPAGLAPGSFPAHAGLGSWDLADSGVPLSTLLCRALWTQQHRDKGRCVELRVRCGGTLCGHTGTPDLEVDREVERWCFRPLVARALAPAPGTGPPPRRGGGRRRVLPRARTSQPSVAGLHPLHSERGRWCLRSATPQPAGVPRHRSPWRPVWTVSRLLSAGS